MIKLLRQKAEKLGRHPRQVALFSSVGVLNTVLDFVVYSAAILLGMSPALANVAGFAAANPFSYAVNARVTFRTEGQRAATSFRGYGKFLAAHLVSLVISTTAVHYLALQFGPFVAKICVIFLTLAINYGASALFVFPQRNERS